MCFPEKVLAYSTESCLLVDNVLQTQGNACKGGSKGKPAVSLNQVRSVLATPSLPAGTVRLFDYEHERCMYLSLFTAAAEKVAINQQGTLLSAYSVLR